MKMNDFEEHINALSSSDWQKLFDLKNEIKSTETLGEWHRSTSPTGEKIRYFDGAPIVYQFQEVVFELGLLPEFDWMNWEQGGEILNNKDTDLNKLDLLTLCKLLTVIVRGNRFAEGLLVMHFENGNALSIIEAIEKKYIPILTDEEAYQESIIWGVKEMTESHLELLQIAKEIAFSGESEVVKKLFDRTGFIQPSDEDILKIEDLNVRLLLKTSMGLLDAIEKLRNLNDISNCDLEVERA